MNYKVKITTQNNKKVIEELKNLRELINYLWLAEYSDVKNIKVCNTKKKQRKGK